MTQTQAETWANSPNQYVADEEEETFTSRVSGELLIDEINNVRIDGALMALLGRIQDCQRIASWVSGSQFQKHIVDCALQMCNT